MSIDKSQRPVGEIYCKHSSGAAHFALGWDGSPSISLNTDESRNCHFGSSRPQCPTTSGCNDKHVTALCCSPSPKCGNGKVDDPTEECDDGNSSDDDDCLSTCTFRLVYAVLHIFNIAFYIRTPGSGTYC